MEFKRTSKRTFQKKKAKLLADQKEKEEKDAEIAAKEAAKDAKDKGEKSKSSEDGEGGKDKDGKPKVELVAKKQIGDDAAN